MSELLLVRHAQASFFGDDYDQLSQLGEEQAARLGDYLAARGTTFSRVFTGPAQRHRHTAEIVGDRLRAAGLEWPEPVVLDGLNEHSAHQLLPGSADAVAAGGPQLERLADAYRSATDPQEVQKAYQRLFEAVVRLWCSGAFALPGVGSWADFQQGVGDAVRTMTAGQPSGSRILAVSSVGTMSAVLRHVLELPVLRALEMAWRVRNCSLSRFLFTNDKITLDTFNMLDHLPGPELITYR